MKRAFRYLMILAFAALCAWIIFTLLGILADTDAGQRDRDDLRKSVAALTATNELLEKQIKDLGETPVVSTPNTLKPQETRYVPVPGPPGPPGPMGPMAPKAEDGRDGVDGISPPAPPAGKDGRNGADGKNGTDGKDGRGIQSMTCNDDGTWTVTYTDSTTQTVDGPCRAVLIP